MSGHAVPRTVAVALAVAAVPHAAAAIRATTPDAYIRIDLANIPPVLGTAEESFSLVMWLRRSAGGAGPAHLLDAGGALSMRVDPADQSIHVCRAGMAEPIDLALPLRQDGAVPTDQWILLAVSWDGTAQALWGWARSESAGPVQASAAMKGFQAAPPTGDLLIGRPDASGGAAQTGLYGLIVIRDHTLVESDVQDLWSSADYLAPYRLDNTSSGGGLGGPGGVLWMVNHAIPTRPTGGVLQGPLTAALPGAPATPTNFCVYGTGPGAGSNYVDAGAVEAASTGADAFVYESPYEAGPLLARRAVDIGLEGPPATSAAAAPTIRALARDERSGVRRVIVGGNSRAIGRSDADGQTYPENFAHGFIGCRAGSTAGVLNRPAATAGGSAWFGYDCTDPPRFAGSVHPVDTTSLPEGSFSYLWTGSTNSPALGTGTGLYLPDGALVSMKCRPEAGSLMDGSAGDGTGADFPLTVRAYLLRFPGAGAVTWRPEKASGQSLPGTAGPATVEALDTTAFEYALSSAAGDLLLSGQRTMIIDGDHTAAIAPGDACYVSAGTAQGAISVVQSVAALAGPRTQIVLEKWFPINPALDSSTLRFGPWSIHALEHSWAALHASDPEIWRGVELAATGGPVVAFAFDAWRPDVDGFAFGVYGTGGLGYAMQIQRAFGQTHPRAIAALQPDVWLQVIAIQGSEPGSMSDFLALVRQGAPSVEAAWLGDAANLTIAPSWHAYIMANAAGEGIPAASVVEEPSMGHVQDQAADGGRADMSHYSHQGNVALAVAWLALLSDAALAPGDLDGDGIVGVTDLLGLLAAWGPCPRPPASCPADIDEDGAIGIADLLLLLVNWG